MRKPEFVVYIAVSLDGYIARPDGSVDWLEPYPAQEFGYDEFIEGIDTVLMGRVTYEQTLGFGPWPYSGKRAIVLSSQLIDSLPSEAEQHSGEISGLIEDLRASSQKDIWVMGGARTIHSLLEADVIDRFELYVIPVMLGDGIPLFHKTIRQHTLDLQTAEGLSKGVVKLVYCMLNRSGH